MQNYESKNKRRVWPQLHRVAPLNFQSNNFPLKEDCSYLLNSIWHKLNNRIHQHLEYANILAFLKKANILAYAKIKADILAFSEKKPKYWLFAKILAFLFLTANKALLFNCYPFLSQFWRGPKSHGYS